MVNLGWIPYSRKKKLVLMLLYPVHGTDNYQIYSSGSVYVD